ncbi:hypothetical protein GCM10025734_02730 [Kitasatospora paranensis]
MRGTLQLGSPSWIAEVVGSPLVLAGVPCGTSPAVGVPGAYRGALNLGGIANLTVAGTMDGQAVAYATGPANALLDAAVLQATRRNYDRERGPGGLRPRRRRAPAASPDGAVLSAAGTEIHRQGTVPLRLPGQKAGGAPGVGGTQPAVADLATLAALTARTVADEVRRHALGEVLVSGRGCRNPVLTAELPGVRLVPSGTVGLPSDAKEAAAFAVLGWYTIHGLPASLPSRTGARGPRVLGSVAPGPGGLPRPAAVRRAPATTVFRTG